MDAEEAHPVAAGVATTEEVRRLLRREPQRKASSQLGSVRKHEVEVLGHGRSELGHNSSRVVSARSSVTTARENDVERELTRRFGQSQGTHNEQTR